jgi:palmitoyl-protein thioesterase
MKSIADFFSNNLNTYAVCIETAGGFEDWATSFKSQAETACKAIKSDPKLQNEFSIVGISQGSLLARYIIQACEMSGTVKRYISIGGPQMGVAKFPHCDSGPLCYMLNHIVFSSIYTSFVQDHVGPAGYFKDINNYNGYLQYSTFLADLNNERKIKNPLYKEKILNLEKVVLIKFSIDSMILPKETAWFEFLNVNGDVVSLKDSDFYKSDYIGIRQLTEENKIDFVELEGNHLNFDRDDIRKYMFPALK